MIILHAHVTFTHLDRTHRQLVDYHCISNLTFFVIFFLISGLCQNLSLFFLMIQKMIQPFRHLQTTSAFKEFDLLDQNICDNLSITFLYFSPALPLSYCIYCFGCKFIKTKFNFV